MKLPELTDINPDPRIVEVNLATRVASVEIAPGVRIESAWTYEGGLPGPLIRVRVDDRLIVHFANNLPEPTTVHWHGLRIPIQMDGVPGHSQSDVPPGGTFTYDFVVPDAGLYWYHPHVMSAKQVGYGLYGALLVEDPTENVGVTDEIVLVLSDVATDERGVLEHHDSGGSTGMAFGREGNHVLINGRKDRKLLARPGAPQRWRVVNAAKSRHFRIDIEGQTFTTIGGDGGLNEYAVRSEVLELAAGERADVIITPSGAPGSEQIVRVLPFDRGYGSIEYRAEEQLFTLAFAGSPYAGPDLPNTARAIDPLSQKGATHVEVEFTITQKTDKSFQYGVNGIPFWKAKPFLAEVGETQVWTVNNSTPWSHPFHLHGFFFQVLDDHNQPVRPLAWKDTVNVPYKTKARFIVRFDDRPGVWMFHCHILDHADGGLMGNIQVGAPPAGLEFTPHSHRGHP